MMCEITVFTATFNRKEQLSDLYQSLLKQEFKDFEWLIVDDGSTDDTQKLVEEFIQENKINIHLLVQQNAGKMVAYNRGVENALGEFFVCIDSDDELQENILTRVHKDYQSIKFIEDLAGMGYLVTDKKTNKVVGAPYPLEPLVCSYYEMIHIYKGNGDKQLMFKTNILKLFPFPVQEKEKFITEAIVYNRISLNYKMMFVNQSASLVEYNEDGYSKNYWKIAIQNPRGWMLYYYETYKWDPSFYNTYGYCLYSFIAKIPWLDIVWQHESKWKAFICSFVAYVKYRKVMTIWKK